jgi:hypothetical protein
MANARSTPPQFGLRSIFAAVLLVAVLSALLAPQVRAAKAWQHEGFIGVWAGALISGLIVILVSVTIHWRMAARGGRSLARLRQPWITRLATICLGVVLVILLVQISLGAGANASRPEDRAFCFLIGVLVGFITPVPWLAALFGDCYPQLREEGFYETYGFHRWSEVADYQWRERPRLLLEIELSERVVSIPILPEHRDTIAATFAERVPLQAPRRETGG